VAMLLMMTANQSTWADDLFPPPFDFAPELDFPWDRDPLLAASQRTTFAEWSFDNSATMPEPGLITGDFKDELDTAFGGDHPTLGTGAGMSYLDGTGPGGASGWQATSPNIQENTLAFNIPNWVDQEPDKWLAAQITYHGQLPTSQVFAFLGLSDPVDDVSLPFFNTLLTDPDLPNGASFRHEIWEIHPNPDWEQYVLFVPEGTFIDQVVIDTISNPEPGAFAVTLVGSMLLMTRRRNRRG